MADYDDFVEDSQYVKALKDRDKAWDNVARYMCRLSKLSGEDPNALSLWIFV